MVAGKFFPTTFSVFDIEVSPGITIHGVKSPDNGPPMLLLHGFPQTHIIWRRVAPTLAEHYTLVIPDLRGYGASSKPPAPTAAPHDHSLYSKTAMAADMSTLMKHLGHAAFFLVGHDRGGRVAHQLAIDAPSEVRAAMVLDICPTLAMYGATGQAFATAYWHWFFLIQPAPFPEQLITANPREFIAKQVSGMYAGAETFGEDAIGEYTAMMSDPAAAHSTCEDYRASATLDMEMQKKDRADGRRIKSPLRAIWAKYGVCSRLFKPRDEWKQICAEGMFDDAGSCAFECGHYIPEEKPEELVKSILEFCKT